MKRRRFSQDDGKPKVPGYIVTFSDMVTLLLTFFVMLLSLAQDQNPELFREGREAFLQSIRYVGLGALLGKGREPNFSNYKWKYVVNNPDKTHDVRTISSRQEDIEQIFKRINHEMTTMPANIVGDKADFTVTGIRFGGEEWALNDAGREYLDEFSSDLRQGEGTGPVRLYVLGLAGDARGEKNQMLVSAKRAKAAADYLRSKLEGTGWPVYSWGSGAGGCWVGPDSAASGDSQILVAVLRGGQAG